ncbi:coiled-coil domain-containing protein 78 isoform X3 [Corvus hawaiiensis]|nr:coiled-coil domain-containing protein 78 isoform X3 [Corvus hawaiiensis]
MRHLGDPQEEMGKLPGSKTDFPGRMVLSEEEKLKISKDLVDLQIETNKMKERYETENFELKNTLQALESRVQELELCSARVTEERDSLRERLQVLESSRQQLVEEFIILKSNYLALGRELDQEVMRNEELTQELLSLAKESPHPAGSAQQSSPELRRGRAAGHPRSARRGKPEDAAAPEHEQQELERNLLGNQDHIKVELEKLKKAHDEQQQKLEERVLALGKELQEAKGAIGDSRHRLAEQSAVLLTSQRQLQEVEAENSRLQLRLKELNEEYRSRLAQYIRDVANYMDSKPSSVTGHDKVPAGQAAMKHFVDSMLRDIRASYKSREEQLARAARGYKKRMKDLAKKHENLLIAYGWPEPAGPSEWHLQEQQNCSVMSPKGGPDPCGSLQAAAGADPLPGEQCRGLWPCRAPLLHHGPRAADKQLPGAESAAGGEGKAGDAAPGAAEEGSGAGEEPAADPGCGGRGAGVGAAGVHRSAPCQVQAGDPPAAERREQRGAPSAPRQDRQPPAIAAPALGTPASQGRSAFYGLPGKDPARAGSWEQRGNPRGCSWSQVHRTQTRQDNCVSSVPSHPPAAGILLLPEHASDTGSASQAALYCWAAGTGSCSGCNVFPG